MWFLGHKMLLTKKKYFKQRLPYSFKWAFHLFSVLGSKHFGAIRKSTRNIWLRKDFCKLWSNIQYIHSLLLINSEFKNPRHFTPTESRCVQRFQPALRRWSADGYWERGCYNQTPWVVKCVLYNKIFITKFWSKSIKNLISSLAYMNKNKHPEKADELYLDTFVCLIRFLQV